MSLDRSSISNTPLSEVALGEADGVSETVILSKNGVLLLAAGFETAGLKRAQEAIRHIA
jgi:hypothetical protein